MAIAVVVGSLSGAVLGVVGSLAGLTSGVGMYAWPIFTAVIIGASIGLFSVYAKRKLKLPGKTKP